MVYVCMTCYSILDKHNLKEINEYHTCPMRHCSGAVIELDEMIAPTVIMLNQKGYNTTNCCAGHIDDDKGYITFQTDESMDDSDLPLPFPEGTYKHDREKNNVFRWDFKTKQFSGDRIKEIGDFHKMLYEWVESLETVEW